MSGDGVDDLRPRRLQAETRVQWPEAASVARRRRSWRSGSAGHGAHARPRRVEGTRVLDAAADAAARRPRQPPGSARPDGRRTRRASCCGPSRRGRRPRSRRRPAGCRRRPRSSGRRRRGRAAGRSAAAAGAGRAAVPRGKEHVGEAARAVVRCVADRAGPDGRPLRRSSRRRGGAVDTAASRRRGRPTTSLRPRRGRAPRAVAGAVRCGHEPTVVRPRNAAITRVSPGRNAGRRRPQLPIPSTGAPAGDQAARLQDFPEPIEVRLEPGRRRRRRAERLRQVERLRLDPLGDRRR